MPDGPGSKIPDSAVPLKKDGAASATVVEEIIDQRMDDAGDIGTDGIVWGMPPSAEKLAEWKRPKPAAGEAFDPAKHGFGPNGVRVATFPGGLQFFFRLLTRQEYKAIVYGPFTLEERENEMCNRCVLWPEGIDFTKAFEDQNQGLPSMLVEYIMDQSGFLPALEVKKA